MIHGDALVLLMSEAFQLTLNEAREYFDKPGKDVAYCGYSSNHAWRPVSLADGVPLEGGTLRVGAHRHLVLPWRGEHVKAELTTLDSDRSSVTIVGMSPT